MTETYGYNYQPKVGDKYLTLKSKGDLVDIRIVSTPLHKAIHWTADSEGKTVQVDCQVSPCEYCDRAKEIKDQQAANRAKAKEVFGWIVLDRNDESKPKIFKGGTSIYLAIKGLAESKAWGNPQTYDIEIERTEEKPMFYRITPLPDKGEITAKEKEAIKKADLDLEAEIGGGEPTNTFGKEEEENVVGKAVEELEKGV